MIDPFRCPLYYKFDRWLDMILKKLSINLCLLTLSLQLCSFAVACLEDCHSRLPSCHREQVREPAPACPHSNAASGFAVAAKSGCHCAIQAPQPLATRNLVISDRSRTEVSKLSVVAADFSSKMVFSLLETRLHSPPSFLGLTQQHTFLLNSNLRI